MAGILIRWLILTAAILAAAYLVDGIVVTGFWAAFFAAAILGILNVFFKPLLILLTLPVNILTLGLFTVVINAVLLKMASALITGFDIHGFWPAVFGAVIISVVNWLLSTLISDRGNPGGPGNPGNSGSTPALPPRGNRPREEGGSLGMSPLTPAMRQYLEIKARYPDCILFFRMGDFYEMFFEDAVLASKLLEITLTSRDKGREDSVPLCGFPWHAASSYIAKLIEKGHKVAICEQMEDPRFAKGIVKREVVRVITPGLVVDPDNLEAKQNNFLAGIAVRGEGFGLAFLDISTGEFRVTEIVDRNFFIDEVIRHGFREIVLEENLKDAVLETILTRELGELRDQPLPAGLVRSRCRARHPRRALSRRGDREARTRAPCRPDRRGGGRASLCARDPEGAPRAHQSTSPGITRRASSSSTTRQSETWSSLPRPRGELARERSSTFSTRP